MLGDLPAHVKWFVDPALYPTRYELLASPAVVAAFAVALLAVAAAVLVERFVPEPAALRALERFASTTPLALALHVGVALLAAAALGLLFVPALRVERDGYGVALLMAEGLCGLLILSGLFTRFAAALLAALGVAAMAPFTFEGILEQVHILGIAVFFLLLGRGAPSLDRLRGATPVLDDEDLPTLALTVLRVAMGFGIAFGALTEKLLNPALAAALLAQRPELNALRPLGIGDPAFVYLAGLVELAVGSVILSGRLTRPVIAFGAALFTVTLPFFGWSELLGHLPYYGIMFTLFIVPRPDTRRARRALRPVA